MATPQFILDLRERIGHRELWLSGVTAIILRDPAGKAVNGASSESEGVVKPAGAHDAATGNPDSREVLLVQRSDDQRWTPVTGIIDPREQPNVAAAREAKEEAGVDINVDRVLWVQSLPEPITYPNGDVASYLDIAFACSMAEGSGEAAVSDDENDAVGWFPVASLPPMGERFRRLIDAALEPAHLPTRFGVSQGHRGN